MKTNDLLVALEGLKGVTFAGITMETVVDLSGGKANLMKGRVTKISESVAMVAKTADDVSVYENAVNKRLEAEGKEPNFESGRLPWGEWKDGLFGLIIEHTPKKSGIKGDYIRLAILSSGTPKYFLDGKPIDKDAIEGLPVKKTEGKQGGLSEESKMFIRSPKVESIRSIRAFGEEYSAA